MTGEL
jgi:hypothetical protein